MTFQSPQFQSLLQNIMAMRNQQQPPQQSNNQGIPQNAGTGSGGIGGGMPMGQGSNSSLNQIQATSQLFGYNPSTTFGYNMNPSTQANAPSQNVNQAGGIGGMLSQLFGALNLFGG